MIGEDLEKFSGIRVMRNPAIGRVPIRNLPKNRSLNQFVGELCLSLFSKSSIFAQCKDSVNHSFQENIHILFLPQVFHTSHYLFINHIFILSCSIFLTLSYYIFIYYLIPPFHFCFYSYIHPLTYKIIMQSFRRMKCYNDSFM